MFNQDYSPSLIAAIKSARIFAQKEHFGSYGVAHLALALFSESTGLSQILQSIGKDTSYIIEWFEVYKEVYAGKEGNSDMPEPDEELQRVLEEAERSRIKFGADCIDALCVFTAIIREGVVFSAQQIESLAIQEQEILEQYNVPSKILHSSGEEVASELSQYVYNMRNPEVMEDGALVIGREKEVRAIVENLERAEKKGTVLIGDSGIGKTAIIKSLVNYLDSFDDEFGEIPILGMNSHKLIASCNQDSEISKKLLDLFDKLNKIDTRCILIIDDWQILLESASDKASVIANIFSSQLSDGRTNLIFSITNDAYRKNIEKHPLNSKLEVSFLEELPSLLMLECLKRHKDRLQSFYSIKISDDVLENLLFLSKRYFKGKKLPYGAIDLLDRTIASVMLSNKRALKEIEVVEKKYTKIVDVKSSDILVLYRIVSSQVSIVLLSKLACEYTFSEDVDLGILTAQFSKFLEELKEIARQPLNSITNNEIEVIVAEITGIPLGKIQAGEKEKLLHINESLQERVKGQNTAISTLSDAIIESRSGLSNPKQPIGSFFFLGPTGTGKTELAKSLAYLLFDDENAMVRFDMSEFKEEHSAALLYGAPPGYVGYEEGGMLVNKIRQTPYAVVLFDEIEKAHSSVYDVFLQIMDEGVIHDKLGRDGDFSNAIIIFTSNLGSQWIADKLSAGHHPTSNELIDVMTSHFRPEFLGRLTEVVPFAPINATVAQDIFKLQLLRLQKQLLEQKEITLTLSDSALEFLSQKGFSEKYGARPIAGVIRTYIKKAISKFIVSGEIKGKDKILLDYKNTELIWELC